MLGRSHARSLLPSTPRTYACTPALHSPVARPRRTKETTRTGVSTPSQHSGTVPSFASRRKHGRCAGALPLRIDSRCGPTKRDANAVAKLVVRTGVLPTLRHYSRSLQRPFSAQCVPPTICGSTRVDPDGTNHGQGGRTRHASDLSVGRPSMP